MKRPLLLLYAALVILTIVQSFSHSFMDEPIMSIESSMISHGLLPYQDFFEHHLVLHTFFLAPVFWLASGGSALFLFHLLAIGGVLFCAWLVFRIARKENFAYPHAASVFFLVAATGLPMVFLRNEFFSMLFVLIFFAFEKPFVRGLSIALLCATSPLMLPPSLGIIAWYIWTRRKKVAELSQFIGGGLTGGLIWLTLYRNVSFELIYSSVITFNNAISSIYSLPWKEVTFFSLFFILPLLVVGLTILAAKAKTRRDYIIMALLFASIATLQVIAANVQYGAFTRIKLPNFIPVLAVLAPAVAMLKPKHATLLIIAQLILTLFVYTPHFDFPRAENIAIANELDRCVSSDAEILVRDKEITTAYVPLFRQPAEYHWFAQYTYPLAKIDYQEPTFNDPIMLCGNKMAAADLRCDTIAIAKIKARCDALNEPRSLYKQLRS